jgi:hypothetical protein
MRQTIKSILLATAVTFGTVYAQASTTSPKTDFIVQALSTNPEFVGNTSEDLLLHDGDDGSTYLYVEQQQGGVLTIFDVTSPDHMKLLKSVPTETHGSYDFVTPLGGSAELISFRDGSGTAVLDLRNTKTPRVTLIEGPASLPTETFGSVGYLSLRQHATPTAPAQLRDVQLVETSQSPRLLTTMTGVTKETSRAQTGTIFLLGEREITVIRRKDAEREYAFQKALNQN